MSYLDWHNRDVELMPTIRWYLSSTMGSKNRRYPSSILNKGAKIMGTLDLIEQLIKDARERLIKEIEIVSCCEQKEDEWKIWEAGVNRRPLLRGECKNCKHVWYVGLEIHELSTVSQESGDGK